MNTPLRRHPALQPLSREHHYGLLLSWKIREGFKRNIAPERIKKYVDWFWENHLNPHFNAEEKYLFSILPAQNEHIRKALSEHRRLKRLFTGESEPIRTLSLIEEELENHIRFEERVLFNEIQQQATPEQLELLEQHQHVIADNWNDEFWK
ncbi:hemerythrin domain-containing protein [Pedobacter sp.]|uniref:hemerythrin domain-containing protein n=1 Tax=Pedobacter sp. TaxID=1411316 RepID=UPI00396C9CEA